jgi:AcrR family transcriptional regulator
MTEKRTRGRPRREGADEDILRATRELLDESGYAAFNVDVVAERTGIAKTTIYRRWPTKGALVAAAIDTTPIATEPDAILRETETLLARLNQLDADAIDVIRAVIAPRRERLRLALEQRHTEGIANNELADKLLGALLIQRLLDNKPTVRSFSS